MPPGSGARDGGGPDGGGPDGGGAAVEAAALAVGVRGAVGVAAGGRVGCVRAVAAGVVRARVGEGRGELRSGLGVGDDSGTTVGSTGPAVADGSGWVAPQRVAVPADVGDGGADCAAAGTAGTRTTSRPAATRRRARRRGADADTAGS